jgi:hypothetical protein
VVLVGLATTANVKRPGDLAVPGRLRAWLRGRATDCAEALRDDYAGTVSAPFEFLKHASAWGQDADQRYQLLK